MPIFAVLLYTFITFMILHSVINYYPYETHLLITFFSFFLLLTFNIRIHIKA